MTIIEKGKRIRDHVETIEKLEKADSMLHDKGYHAPSISIHIHRRNQVGASEEVMVDGDCVRDIIHKIIKEMKDMHNKNLDELLKSKDQ